MRTLLVLAMTAASGIAYAADGTFTFRLDQDPGNLTDCIRMAPSFERPFILTVSSGTATLTSAGGVHIGMSPSAPDRYHGIFDLSGERLDYTAELGASKTLSVRGNNLGCKWMGKAQ
jgi:hypothetical protein